MLSRRAAAAASIVGLVLTASTVRAQLGTATSFAEFHGYVDLEYLDFEKDGPQSGTPSFDNHHFYFQAYAEPSPQVLVLGEIEYEHGGEEFNIDRAFIRWKPSRRAQFMFGKFYVPFGIERFYYYSPVNKLVSRPASSKEILGHEWSDVGVLVEGTLPAKGVALRAEVAVVNGSGHSKDGGEALTRDNNPDKTFATRIGAELPNGLNAGLSVARGREGEARGTDTYWGADFSYATEDLHLRAEYFAASEACGRRREGYYAESAYKFMRKNGWLDYAELSARVNGLDPDLAVSDNSDQTSISVGINISPVPHLLFKAEYMVVLEESGGDLDNNGVLFQCSADF